MNRLLTEYKFKQIICNLILIYNKFIQAAANANGGALKSTLQGVQYTTDGVANALKATGKDIGGVATGLGKAGKCITNIVGDLTSGLASGTGNLLQHLPAALEALITALESDGVVGDALNDAVNAVV